ncbi:hypothetical protein B0J13DRAFT_581448 [Dactylonectria estremocensis]|uniref:Nephrocystin 3-like N-terminal domain-containing protein n=1 Tax=Dactylonectria estremocensis TaxID=1079267 RepID=A0A9P9FF56_9HYPO|nr:hypothetical protein B0J13DRAFT_581448 [Dactylonectria estremocensis]
MQLNNPKLYTIGWIAALPIERAAATALFNNCHKNPTDFYKPQSDPNSYETTPAATIASNLISSLPYIRIGLLVGIGGGIAQPKQGRDIRLSDVILKGSLNKPPRVLLHALASLRAKYERRPTQIPDLLQRMYTTNPLMTRPKTNFTYQGFENDHLFPSTYDHIGGNTCDKCDHSQEVERDPRDSTDPEIHYGVIASGNTLIKDPSTRDRILAVAGEQCMCVEMEAAGLMDHFPCLVIRGICDYADSHKNDRWQRYASATAASFASFTNRLPVADGAFFDSHGDGHNATCLPNTRVNLLRQIHQWANDPCAKSIFWLKGMAGTGKSTISRTVAQSCVRGGPYRGNMSKFFTTIAAQLAQREPVIVSSIEAAINADPYIAGKALQDQFDQLIIQPLGNIPPDARRLDTLVLVVDALDECDTETDIKLLINLLSRTKNLHRPELPIHLGFTSIKGSYQDLVLHKIPEEIIKDDITAFFKYELARIKTDYNSSMPTNRQLPLNWPEEGNIQLLIRMAIPLFIFTATVCRFIDDRKCGSPYTQLAQILSHRSSVLSSQLKEVLQKDKDKIINEFTLIVGTIVTFASPLSVLALSQLLNISPDIVDTRLDTLHSVLDVPVEHYLINPEEKKTNELWVDENSAHCNLGKQCLRIMDEGLRENICSMSFPGMRRSTIDSQQIDKCLSPELQYACLYLVHHRTATDLELNNMQEVYDFLVEHFLHWLEAMSFMGRTVEGLSILRSLADWLKDREALSLSSFVSDAVRFVKMNFSVIDMTPLQIYSSALVFTPSTSIIRRSFEDPIPTWLSFWPHINEDWDACLSILEGHNNWVRSVVFSHDSKLVASASHDTTVRIWSVETGKCEQREKSIFATSGVSQWDYSYIRG